jgi:hypothetical protein
MTVEALNVSACDGTGMLAGTPLDDGPPHLRREHAQDRLAQWTGSRWGSHLSSFRLCGCSGLAGLMTASR